MESSATLTIEIKRDNNLLYQTIKITPTKRTHIRYFMYDKYVIGRSVDDLLDTLYVGDGENIFFESKQKFRSQIMITYRIENEIELPKNKKLFIKGGVPKFDGCIYCQHIKESKMGKSRCMYYRKFLNKLKTFCSDFIEKDN